ncbi:DEKNAAC105320 [Brettanomyces naardenensis]|uniref:Ribosome biogenesis protein YTM1 n=1 Tax=Brettanomyces naardenensis TaxID=13370 RepID=A0A448YTJ1_BRENA|nr:DEKNAAC105320 [Brettanomyces naardenensis]
MDPHQVKIKLVTRDQDQALHVAPNPLYVPVSLKRYGLSEILNHLLETESPVPFEFIIDGTILKGSLNDYLTSNGLSSEAFLTLEYTRAVLPPKFLASFSNEDWISSIDSIGTMTNEGTVTSPKILSGSYDGIVRIYNMQGKVETQLMGHQQPVKAVKFLTPARFLSAGMDRVIRLWKAGAISDEDLDKDTQNGRTIALLDYHQSTVSSLAVNLATSRILSGSYDNTVALWSTKPKEMTSSDPVDTGNDGNLSSASRKRLKLAIKDSTIKRKNPLAVLESHRQPVEGVIFDPKDSTVGYSVSQDHTIKTWDLVTARCVDSKQTSYPLLSIASLEKLGLLATGSSARHINLHDPRSSKITNTQLIGHTNFVCSLVAPSENEYTLLSGSHDGTVKVWDVRADRAVYTISRESGKSKSKVFAVDWEKEIGIISGGEDKEVQINESNLQDLASR